MLLPCCTTVYNKSAVVQQHVSIYLDFVVRLSTTSLLLYNNTFPYIWILLYDCLQQVCCCTTTRFHISGFCCTTVYNKSAVVQQHVSIYLDFVVRLSTTSLLLYNNTFPYIWILLYDCLQQVCCCTTTRFHISGFCCTTVYNKSAVVQQHVSIYLDFVVRLSTTSLLLYNNTFPYIWILLYDCLQQVCCCTTTRFHISGFCCTTVYNKSAVVQQHVSIYLDFVVRLSTTSLLLYNNTFPYIWILLYDCTTSLLLYNNTFPYIWILLYDCLQQVCCCTTTRFHISGFCCTTVYNKSAVVQQHVSIYLDFVVRLSTTSLLLYNNTFPYIWILLYDCLQQVCCCTTTRFHISGFCCTTVYNKSAVVQQHVSIYLDFVVRLSTTSLLLYNNTFPYIWILLYDCLQQVCCCTTTRFHISGFCCTTVYNKSAVVQQHVSIYLDFVVRLSTTSLLLYNNTFPYIWILLYDCLQQVCCCTTTRFHISGFCCTTVYNKSAVVQQHVSIYLDFVVRLSTTSLLLYNNTFPYIWILLYDCLQQVCCCTTTRFHISGFCCTTVYNKSAVVQQHVSIYLDFVVRLSTTSLLLYNNTFPYIWILLYDCLQQVCCCTTTRFHISGFCCTTVYNKSAVVQQHVSIYLDFVVRLSTTSLLLYNNTFPYIWILLYDCLQQVCCCTTTRFHISGFCCTTVYNKSAVVQQHVSIYLDFVVRLSTTSLLLYNNTFPYIWILLYDCLQQVCCCTTTRFHISGFCCTTVYNKSAVVQQHVSIYLDFVVRLSTTSLLLYNNTFPYIWILLYDCLQQACCCTTTRVHISGFCCTTVYNKYAMYNNTFPYICIMYVPYRLKVRRPNVTKFQAQVTTVGTRVFVRNGECTK